MDYNAFFYYGGILLLGYIVSILMHEVGHYLCYLQYKGKNNLNVQFGRKEQLFFPITFSLDIDDVPSKYHNDIILWGIVTGAAFIFIIAFILEWYFFGLLFFPYIIGLRHDLKSLQFNNNVKGNTK
jgi:hypothetical protein